MATGNNNGIITDTPGYPLFDLVNNSDVGVKSTLAGDGVSYPGYPAKVLRLALGIAKQAPGQLNTQATQFTFKSDWAGVEAIMPNQLLQVHALRVLSQRFWFDGRPQSPGHGGGGGNGGNGNEA